MIQLKCRPPANRSRSTAAQPIRAGSVSLMLVLVLVFMVGAFAVSLSGRAAQQRRAETQHQSVAVLESAIVTARQANIAGDIQLRLPLDETGGEWVIVERISQQGDLPPQYVATRYRNGQPGPSIRRPAPVDDEAS